ncbi:MAG: hypothetical protein H6850_00575 [Alphaproteobacteria bacterium]|nr:MAG: hypothetical protein H6850_00575 [Alphaproteobacteria bacterium]
MFFFLNSQIHYGASASHRLISGFFSKETDQEKEEAFKSIKAFLGYVTFYNDWLFGIQGFFGGTYNQGYYGAKGLFGYEFEENVQMYGSIGFERQTSEKESFNRGNLFIGGNVDIYLTRTFGLGFGVEGRPLFDHKDNNDIKKFGYLRFMFSVIFRHI